jgi:hypothetical protein
VADVRPFYLIVVVWGERHSGYLLDFCIPSLLAPGNLPSLANRSGNRFLIATTTQDRARLERAAVLARLREYAEPVWLEIAPPAEGVAACVHMGVGHRLATEMAHRDGAYGVLLTPDLMLSDGTLAAVERRAREGYSVVLAAALRFGEEPLFRELEAMGLAARHARDGTQPSALPISGRQMAQASVRAFHSETLRYEWDAECFTLFPVACWWRVPGEDGVVLHCLSWAPLLVDYAAIPEHDSSMMEHWTIDGDYIHANFGERGRVHVVQDSDEAMLVSWTPMSPPSKGDIRAWKFLRAIGAARLVKGAALRDAYFGAFFDPLKRRIFWLPVRWHASEIGAAWREVEDRAQAALRSFLAADERRGPGFRIALRLTGLALRLWTLLRNRWINRRRILEMTGKALRGDPEARRYLRSRMRSFVQQFLGKPMRGR